MKMKITRYAFLMFLVFVPSLVFSQQGKGIDTQTRQIRTDSDRIGSRPNDVGRSIDFGKGKTKVREHLPNPLLVTSRRDVLIESIIETLQEMKIIVDETSSKKSEGLIVTQPFTFAKGPVTTASELSRYAILLDNQGVWSRARYTLIIEVQSIDGIRNKVFVTAKIEGRSESGIGSEWTTLQSSGQAEEDFLRKLVEKIGLKSEEESDSDK